MQIDIQSVKTSELVFRYFFKEIPIHPKAFRAFWREDKTPSASFVEMESGIWILKDFASGKAYDIFEALKEFRDLSFKKAIDFIGSHFPSFVIAPETSPAEWARRRNIKLEALKVNNGEVEFEYFDWGNGNKIGSKFRLFGQEGRFRCKDGLSTKTHFFHRNLGQGDSLYILGSEGDCIAVSQQTKNPCVAISGESHKIPSELVRCINHHKFSRVNIIYDNPIFEPKAGEKQKQLSKALFELESVKIVKGVDWQGSYFKDVGEFLGAGKALESLSFKTLDFEPVNDEIEALKQSINQLRIEEIARLELESVLPLELANYLKQVAEAIDNNFPEEAVLTYFLSIVSGLIGASFQLLNKHSVLWSCVALPVGAGKSDALKFLLRPLAIKEIEFDRIYKEELEAYNVEQKQNWKKGEDFTPRKMPIAQHILLEDSTIEAVRKVYCNNKEGIVVAYDELAKFFQSHGQYKSKGGDDRATYLSLASGAGINLTRVDESQNVRTWKSAVSLTGGIQPAILQSIYKADLQKHDGLWDRFLYFYKNSYKISEEFNREQLPSQSLLFGLYDWILRNRGSEEAYSFELENNDHVEAVSTALKRLINNTEGPFKGYLSKQYNQWIQLALVLHVLECASERSLRRVVSAKTCHKALLCLGFYRSQAVSFFGRVEMTEKANLYARILDLEDLSGRNLITQHMAKNKKEVESIFKEMELAGYGQMAYTERKAVYFKRSKK